MKIKDQNNQTNMAGSSRCLQCLETQQPHSEQTLHQESRYIYQINKKYHENYVELEPGDLKC